MSSVISGTQHFIIPKKIVWTTLLISLGTFLGMYISEHLRAQQAEDFLKHKNDGVKMSNAKLKKEKSEYAVIFGELTEHLDEWKKGRDMSLEQQAKHVISFQEQAQTLMEGLSDMQTLLEEKEFQLWEKEGLLEYQEERLMNSEDLELEMANYINEMAQTLLGKELSLPAGLEEKPYYGSQLTNVDDDPAGGGEYGDRLRGRRLLTRTPVEAKAALKEAGVVLPTMEVSPAMALQAARSMPPHTNKDSVGPLRKHFLALKQEGGA